MMYLGGSLNIDTHRGRGTRLTLTAMLKAQDHEGDDK
jgi:hypothetical protein